MKSGGAIDCQFTSTALANSNDNRKPAFQSQAHFGCTASLDGYCTICVFEHVIDWRSVNHIIKQALPCMKKKDVLDESTAELVRKAKLVCVRGLWLFEVNGKRVTRQINAAIKRGDIKPPTVFLIACKPLPPTPPLSDETPIGELADLSLRADRLLRSMGFQTVGEVRKCIKENPSPLFSLKGMGSTTLYEIATAAGLTDGKFYDYNYRSKANRQKKIAALRKWRAKLKQGFA